RMLDRTPPGALRQLFDGMGLLCREEAEGRVYPYSGQAGAVLDALRFACARQGVELLTQSRVTAIEPQKEGFRLLAQGGAFFARKVIVAAGGRAAPAFGADGDGVGLLKALGHAASPERPALAPLRLPPQSIRGMKGVRLRAGVSLLCEGCAVKAESGEVIFSDASVSGVAAMQLCRDAAQALAQKKPVLLRLDLLPGLEAEPLLRARAALLRAEAAERLFTGLLPTRAALCLLRAAGYPPQGPARDAPLPALAGLLHAWDLPVEGVGGFEQAQVTAGGLLLRDFCAETLESRLVPGLYACGEALDFDGDCGGYNLMWAWLSGHRAGAAAAEALP
ncbi:MAG: aminoacetone oxidase family FAD-binding enzyme, partial [Clostridia bacterium]|nr:aminoacetone oxidase family FAD-binding enzyme [Clostridia bacterium]